MIKEASNNSTSIVEKILLLKVIKVKKSCWLVGSKKVIYIMVKRPRETLIRNHNEYIGCDRSRNVR